ncbi:MAG: ABC transporter, permease protein 1 (cluster 1, maltose/g3p/polyamine/iron), partial [uncultured Thermomicrobiales bacterium]
ERFSGPAAPGARPVGRWHLRRASATDRLAPRRPGGRRARRGRPLPARLLPDAQLPAMGSADPGPSLPRPRQLRPGADRRPDLGGTPEHPDRGGGRGRAPVRARARAGARDGRRAAGQAFRAAALDAAGDDGPGRRRLHLAAALGHPLRGDQPGARLAAGAGGGDRLAGGAPHGPLCDGRDRGLAVDPVHVPGSAGGPLQSESGALRRGGARRRRLVERPARRHPAGPGAGDRRRAPLPGARRLQDLRPCLHLHPGWPRHRDRVALLVRLPARLQVLPDGLRGGRLLPHPDRPDRRRQPLRRPLRAGGAGV